jgi:hypothetical protein
MSRHWSYRIRGVVYGAVCSLALVVAVAIGAAVLRNEFPYNSYKGASDRSLRVARKVAAPIVVPAGALAGVVLAEVLWRYKRLDDQRTN